MPLIKKNDSEGPRRARQVGELTMIPIYLVGGVLIGFWFGGWCDAKFGTAPYAKVVLMLLGALGGMRESWRIVRQISASENGACGKSGEDKKSR